MTNHDARICRNISQQLSEWLDNQAANPRHIEAHLRECAHCARKARELKTISKELKNMTAPRVNQKFADQVADRIRAAAPAQPSYRRAAAGVLAAAASFAIVAAAILTQRQHAPENFGIAGTDTRHEMQNGDAWIVAEILQGADPEIWDYGLPVPPNMLETSEEELVMSLAQSPWFMQAADAWEARAELDELVTALDDMEKMEFKRLLNMYKESIDI